MSDSLKHLREAIQAEVLGESMRRDRYQAMTKKIIEFQDGIGLTPTPEQLAQWREDTEAILLKRMQLQVS